MAYETKQVTFCDSEVSTLADLAKELKGMYDWTEWRVEEGRNIVFKAVDSEDGELKEGYVGPSGFAYFLEDDEDDLFGEQDHWEEYDVNWGEDFDFCNYVWGDDEDGNTVMVHD